MGCLNVDQVIIALDATRPLFHPIFGFVSEPKSLLSTLKGVKVAFQPSRYLTGAPQKIYASHVPKEAERRAAIASFPRGVGLNTILVGEALAIRCSWENEYSGTYTAHVGLHSTQGEDAV